MMNSTPAEQQTMDAPPGPDTDTSLRSKLEEKNIADTLKAEELEKISAQVSEGFEYDMRSREEWEKNH